MQKGTFLVHFARSGGKLEFSSKIGLSHFLDYFDPNVIQKNRKKLMGQFWEKRVTDGRINEWTG